MLKAVVLGSVAALALLLGAAASASAGTLDQQQLVGTDDTAIDSAQSLGQTFVAGLSGNLDQVDLSLRSLNAPTLPVTIEVRTAVDGEPGSTVLATQSVPSSAITGTYALVPVTFPVPASVTAGAQYAIVAYSATPTPATDYLWARSPSDVYAHGRAVFQPVSPPSPNWVDTSRDLVFRTYVATPDAQTGSTPTGSTPTGSTPAGQRAAALKKCKKYPKGTPRRKKCIKKALKKPV